jgi:hypothetical protein
MAKAKKVKKLTNSKKLDAIYTWVQAQVAKETPPAPAPEAPPAP